MSHLRYNGNLKMNFFGHTHRYMHTYTNSEVTDLTQCMITAYICETVVRFIIQPHVYRSHSIYLTYCFSFLIYLGTILLTLPKRQNFVVVGVVSSVLLFSHFPTQRPVQLPLIQGQVLYSLMMPCQGMGSSL